jgi:hypothetical protein
MHLEAMRHDRYRELMSGHAAIEQHRKEASAMEAKTQNKTASPTGKPKNSGLQLRQARRREIADYAAGWEQLKNGEEAVRPMGARHRTGRVRSGLARLSIRDRAAHHRAKKQDRQCPHSRPHPGRDLIAFSAAIVVPMNPYLAHKGHPIEMVNRIYDAWWKSMILQVTL